MPYPNDPLLRSSTLALLSQTWLKLSPGIERALAWGADWCELSTPFVEWVDDRVVAHVGIIEINLYVDEQPRRMAGIHAVCTHPEHRGRGHMRKAMERALAWADAHHEGALLWAVDPEAYTRFGFVAQPESMFVGPVRGGPLRARPLALDRAEDLALVREHLQRRLPISHRSGVVNTVDLALIDHALWWPGPQLAYLPELECVIVYTVRERFLDLYDVFALREPCLADIAARLGEQIDTAVVYFSPDRLAAPQLRPEATVLYDTLMLRGLELTAPVAVPTLSRC